MRYQFSPHWHRLGKAALWRLYGNTLPPSINRRYARYANMCGVQGEPNPFGTAIVARNVLQRARARTCSEAISAGIARGDLAPEPTLPFMVAVPRPIDMFGIELLDIFDGPLGDRLRRGYGAEFRIEWLDCYRTYPGERRASWQWHIDNVPPYFVKILLYLTDSDTETGTTEFISSTDTRALMSVGYFGVTPSERTVELETFAARKQVSYQPTSFTLNAGDAVIFSTNSFHRGGLVRRGYRDVMSFAILPSRVSWREHLAKAGTDRLQLAGGFPTRPY